MTKTKTPSFEDWKAKQISYLENKDGVKVKPMTDYIRKLYDMSEGVVYLRTKITPERLVVMGHFKNYRKTPFKVSFTEDNYYEVYNETEIK